MAILPQQAGPPAGPGPAAPAPILPTDGPAPAQGPATAAPAPGGGGPILPGAPPPQNASIYPDQAGMGGGEDMNQDQLDVFMDVVYQIMYIGDTPDGELSSAVLGMLRQGTSSEIADPVSALADTTVSVSSTATRKLSETGSRLDGSVAYAGMVQTLEELADDAIKENLYDYSQEELAAALMKAQQGFYTQVESLGIYPQQEMQQDLSVMQEADASGELDADLDQMMADDGVAFEDDGGSEDAFAEGAAMANDIMDAGGAA